MGTTSVQIEDAGGQRDRRFVRYRVIFSFFFFFQIVDNIHNLFTKKMQFLTLFQRSQTILNGDQQSEDGHQIFISCSQTDEKE